MLTAIRLYYVRYLHERQIARVLNKHDFLIAATHHRLSLVR